MLCKSNSISCFRFRYQQLGLVLAFFTLTYYDIINTYMKSLQTTLQQMRFTEQIININICRHLKLEIALAIPASNDEKIETNNSALKLCSSSVQHQYGIWNICIRHRWESKMYSSQHHISPVTTYHIYYPYHTIDISCINNLQISLYIPICKAPPSATWLYK